MESKDETVYCDLQVAFLQTVSGDENESEDTKKQLAPLLVSLPLGNSAINGHSSTGGLKPQQPATPSTPRKGTGLLGKGKTCS